MSCPPLPSASSAYDLTHGDLGALPLAVAHTLVRAGLMWVGMRAFGRPVGYVDALAGAVGVEVFVLAWAALQD